MKNHVKNWIGYKLKSKLISIGILHNQENILLHVINLIGIEAELRESIPYCTEKKERNVTLCKI